MGVQLESLAYGHPSHGGIVLGGENAAFYTLGDDWTDDHDGDSLVVTGSLWVHGTEAQIEERFQALAAAWIKEQGNCGITSGTRVTTTINLTLSGRELIITATSGTPFATTDLGLPIQLGGVGSFQISTVTSTTVVRCLVPASLTLPSAANGLTAKIGRVLRRVEEVTKFGGFSGVAKLRATESSENEPGRRQYRFTISFDTPARDVRPTEGGLPTDRQRAQVRYRTPPGGDRVVEFSGRFTAADSSDARTRYLAQIEAWITDKMTGLLGASPKYEVVGDDDVTLDDRGGLCSFRAIRREIGFAESAALVDHPAITGAEVTFAPKELMQHGLTGENPPALISVTYRCRLVRGQFTNETAAAVWYQVAYPHLVAQVAAIYGSGVIVTEMSGPAYDPRNATLTAGFVAILPATGSRIVSYQRRVRYLFSRRRTFRDVWDGSDFAAIGSSPGPAIRAVVTVAYTELNSTGKGRSATAGGGVFGVGGLGVDFGGAGLGIFGGTLTISFGEEGGGGGDESGRTGKVEFDPTGAPASAKDFFDAAPFKLSVADAQWVEEDLDVDAGTDGVGHDRHGVSDQATQTTTVIRRTWRWLNLKGFDPRKGADTAGNGSGLSSVADDITATPDPFVDVPQVVQGADG